MPNQFLVTCCLCVWLFSISAPADFYLTMEEPALIASMAAGEEEPGEGETKDSPEELLALPVVLRNQRIIQASADRIPLLNKVNRFQVIPEVVLPPPEAVPLSQTDTP